MTKTDGLHNEYNTAFDLIRKQNEIIEMMIIKLDHIDNYLFPDKDDMTFNINNDINGKNTKDFTDKIMDKYLELQEMLNEE